MEEDANPQSVHPYPQASIEDNYYKLYGLRPGLISSQLNVKLDQGLQMLKIFKEHSIKQCKLDDFEYYEDRQKKIQEKKAKQQQFQKQAWEGKPVVVPPVATSDVADLGVEATLNVEVSEDNVANA